MYISLLLCLMLLPKITVTASPFLEMCSLNYIYAIVGRCCRARTPHLELLQTSAFTDVPINYRHHRVRGGAGGVCLCPLYDGGHFQLHHALFRRSRAWAGLVGPGPWRCWRDGLRQRIQGSPPPPVLRRFDFSDEARLVPGPILDSCRRRGAVFAGQTKAQILVPVAGSDGGRGMIPAAGFFLWFFRVEDFPQSVRSLFAAWIPLLTTSAAHNAFYRWCLGLDMPWVHLQQTILQFLGLAAIAAVCALLCWRKIPGLLAFILPAACALGLIKVSWEFNWFNCGHCLPLVCLALLALLVWRGVKDGWEPPLVFAFLWTVWSLALLAKLGFFCRIWHYGFALAMPAFVSGIYLLLWALPRQLECCGVRPVVFRGLLWLMLLPGLTRLTQASLKLYSDKTSLLAPDDAILAFDPHFRPVDADVAAALRWVETNMPPRATLAVLPKAP